eukprot:scaffold8062_cov71-Cyclotella_meneghiniana.AAC.17
MFRGQTSRSAERIILVTTHHSTGNFDRFVDSAMRCDSRTVKAYSNLKPKENPSCGPPDLKVSPSQNSDPRSE